MSQFLNRVRNVDPNNSELVKEALTAFFQNLPKHKDVNCNQWLRTLENIINRFPKYCGQHRGTIEDYLCHYLDSNNYNNVIEAAKCGHVVQQVRPQQERTASAKSCWRDQMSALCDAAHTLIGELFTKSASIYNKNGKPQKDPQSLTSPLQVTLTDIDAVTNMNDVANKSAVLCTRLRNVLVFIQAMLVEIYPVAKPVRPQAILEVILHTLSASGSEHSSAVTAVKVQGLKTLDALVACLGSNLVPFSALVFRFVMQTLRWSSENASEDTRKVRCAAYSSLTKWLSTLHAHRDAGNNARSWDSELTSHVVSDVTPPKHVIQLTPNAQPMKNLSKKARKKLANSLLMQSNISSHMPGEKNKISVTEESNDELAIAALECTEAFLTTCGIFLKPTIHKQLQELLVRECYNLDRYSGERGTWLLRALEACRKGSPPRVPPPTQYCLHLYSALLNHSQPEISKFASQALLDIRLHLHCSPPSLSFAIVSQPERAREDKRKRLSERNRAVLESLLGQERMPSEDLAEEEEVITIPEEPSSKKPRIEASTDNISLSSDSNTSIEITDTSSVEEIEADSADYIIDNVNMDKEAEKNQNTEDLIVVVEVTENSTSEKQIDDTDGKINDDIEDIYKQNQDDKCNVYEAKTQIPLPSMDLSEEIHSPTESPLSIEIAYDYPNTGQEKVTVLEKMDEDNLPSTNETDDVQITCGQTVNSSQDDAKETETNDVPNENDVPKENGVPKENSVEKSPKRVLENGNATCAEIEGSVAGVIVSDGVEITIVDMMADFVDEVIESQA